MRRTLSIVLLFLFSLPLISPVLALTANSDDFLPACCRRNGAHRCTMKVRPATSAPGGINLSAIPQHCPSYPAVVRQTRHNDLSVPVASLIFAEIVSHPAIKFQTQTRARVALHRARQKRGPPVELL